VTTDRSRKVTSDPVRDGAPVPLLVLWRWPGQCNQQLILLRRSQQPSAGPPLMPLVRDAVGPVLVVAPGNPADPVGRISGNAGNHLGREATG